MNENIPRQMLSFNNPSLLETRVLTKKSYMQKKALFFTSSNSMYIRLKSLNTLEAVVIENALPWWSLEVCRKRRYLITHSTFWARVF